MRTVSFCFTKVLLIASPTTTVIFSLKFLVVFNFLRIDFLSFNSSHCCENQPVLWLGVG